MGKYTKFLYLELALVLLVLPLRAEESLRFKGDYFLYSDEFNYIYGGGNILLKTSNRLVKGNVLYMDVKQLHGIIYGDVRMITQGKDKTKGEKKYNVVFFKGVPTKWLLVFYGEKIDLNGDRALKPLFMNFEKKTPRALKNTPLYYEFAEFRINKNQKIKAKTVIPYMMGLPTVPLKRFTINRGEWAKKTMLAFNSVNYSDLAGLSLSFFLRMREPFIKGDYDLKLYERELFKMDGIKRGVIFSGKSSLLIKKKELLNYSALLNSGEKSFNLRLNHNKDFRYFRYSFSQNISGKGGKPTFFEFSSDVTIKRLKVVVPFFNFTHDLKKSYSYRISTPLNLWKKLTLNVGWQRKIFIGNYRSDTSDFSTSLNFNSRLFSLSSNYNFSKNLLVTSVRKNFSVNLSLKSLCFLEDSIAIDISSFYMFSALPYGDQTQNRISPGVNVNVHSIGISMPLDFNLVPGFTFNHLWDNHQENFTDFNYSLAVEKQIGKFSGSLAYSLASRYREENFWIEGSSRQNMNLNFELKDEKNYSYLIRFFFDDRLALENISFSGRVNLAFDLTFSSFLLYYSKEQKIQTLEVFIEKTFKKKIRVQGGYSLALKRFFIKFLTM